MPNPNMWISKIHVVSILLIIWLRYIQCIICNSRGKVRRWY